MIISAVPKEIFHFLRAVRGLQEGYGLQGLASRSLRYSCQILRDIIQFTRFTISSGIESFLGYVFVGSFELKDIQLHGLRRREVETKGSLSVCGRFNVHTPRCRGSHALMKVVHEVHCDALFWRDGYDITRTATADVREQMLDVKLADYRQYRGYIAMASCH